MTILLAPSPSSSASGSSSSRDARIFHVAPDSRGAWWLEADTGDVGGVFVSKLVALDYVRHELAEDQAVVVLDDRPGEE